MARRRTARQTAASRRNLEIARKKRRRRRVAIGAGVVVGGAAAVGAGAVAYHRPIVTGSKTRPMVVSRRNLGRHNHAHTAEQKAYAAMKYRHTGAIGKKTRVQTISQAEAMRRTNSYMDSVKPKKRTNARRAVAKAHYSQQLRYTATGTSGRRGRARSRALKAQVK